MSAEFTVIFIVVGAIVILGAAAMFLVNAKVQLDDSESTIRARGWSWVKTSTMSFRIEGVQAGVPFQLTKMHVLSDTRTMGRGANEPIMVLEIKAQPVAVVSVYFGKLLMVGLVPQVLRNTLAALAGEAPGEPDDQRRQRFGGMLEQMRERAPETTPWPEHYAYLSLPGDAGPSLMNPALAQLLDAQASTQRAHLIRERDRLLIVLTGTLGCLQEIDQLVGLGVAAAPACGWTPTAR